MLRLGRTAAPPCRKISAVHATAAMRWQGLGLSLSVVPQHQDFSPGHKPSWPGLFIGRSTRPSSGRLWHFGNAIEGNQRGLRRVGQYPEIGNDDRFGNFCVGSVVTRDLGLRGFYGHLSISFEGHSCRAIAPAAWRCSPLFAALRMVTYPLAGKVGRAVDDCKVIGVADDVGDSAIFLECPGCGKAAIGHIASPTTSKSFLLSEIVTARRSESSCAYCIGDMAASWSIVNAHESWHLAHGEVRSRRLDGDAAKKSPAGEEAGRDGSLSCVEDLCLVPSYRDNGRRDRKVHAGQP
jgi:hypothetical protein